MHKFDIIIFGGGIAGLWTLARLTRLGYSAILLENEALGSGQTIKSQGIIHGGLKYALSGNITNSVTALYDMPKLWQQCLAGDGTLDLKEAKILSQHQHMWSIDRLSGGLSTMFASKALKSHIAAIEQTQWPNVMQYCAIKSKLYELAELVLDIPSLIRTLTKPVLHKCLKIDAGGYELDFDSDGNIRSVSVNSRDTVITLQAQRYIFTAGKANSALINNLINRPNMQLRPLHMVLVKDKNLLPLYGHCINLNTVPRLTITTHTANDHTPVWYLGGKLAEDGINLSTVQQIDRTKQELHSIFPKLDLSNAQYATFFVDRAEAKQDDGCKPDTATVFQAQNAIVGWPTKLAFAPILTQQIISLLENNNIKPSHNEEFIVDKYIQPQIAQPMWEQLL